MTRPDEIAALGLISSIRVRIKKIDDLLHDLAPTEPNADEAHGEIHELAYEFEQVVPACLSATSPGDAVREALLLARKELEDGFESDGELEAEHSIRAKAVVAKIDAALAPAEKVGDYSDLTNPELSEVLSDLADFHHEDAAIAALAEAKRRLDAAQDGLAALDAAIQSAAPGGGTKSDGACLSSLPSGESEPLVTTASAPSDPAQEPEAVAWRSVVGFEERYEVSSEGDIRNKKTGKIQAKKLMGSGYVKADLWNGPIHRQTSVHRVVAEAFIAKPLGKNEVNHINGDKADNRVGNLQWCNRAENTNHSRYVLGNDIKPILAKDIETGEEEYYPSIEAAGRLGYNATCISEVLAGRVRTHAGKTWERTEWRGPAGCILYGAPPMTTRDDLVSRLYQHHEAMLGPDYFQAASALEAKDAEIARLREIMDDAADLIKKQQEWQTYGEQLERNSDAAMAAEIQEQRKKNDALRDRISDLERQLAEVTERNQWQPIETAALGEMVLCWHPMWRHEFAGQRNGDNGAVYIDTCETDATGRQDYATHWMPLRSAAIRGGAK